jgi:receptor protein-tyrosine kinase
MSAEPTTPVSQIPDDAMRQAVVLLYRLSTEALESINDLMEKLHLRFADAALHTGAITQHELDEALEWIRRQAMHRGRGIIEEVLRRNVRQSREIVLWEGTPLKPCEQLVLAHDSNHPRSETIRSLRTELLMRMKTHGARTLALLSPCAGEGRSQLAAELAIAFAQLGRRTLLVDADLRRPRQHALFGAENENGLAQALFDGRTLRLRGIEKLPQMALATSGAIPANPLELLSGVRFERLIKEWRRTFEFVLIDTPPTAEFSDAIAVATAAEHVLILGRTDLTSFSAVREMCRKLEMTHAHTLGAVLSKF